MQEVTLDVHGVLSDHSSPGMRQRVDELSRLDVQQHPAAAYNLVAAVLECGIKDFFRAHGREPLHHGTRLTRAVLTYQAYLNLTVGHSPSGNSRSAEVERVTEGLLAARHDPDRMVTPQDVHEAWAVLKPLLAAQDA